MNTVTAVKKTPPFRVEPLKKSERPACAYCGALMLPRNITSVRGSEVASFRSNRRIVQAKPTTSALLATEWWIKFFPNDPKDWGYDGLFCRLRCAQRFAHAVIARDFPINPLADMLADFVAWAEEYRDQCKRAGERPAIDVHRVNRAKALLKKVGHRVPKAEKAVA